MLGCIRTILRRRSFFKRCIVIAAADPDAPTWDKTPVEGIFLSRKVENHE